MNDKEKRIMWTSIFAPILIVMGVALLVLGSLPIKNTKPKNKYIFYLTGNGERVYFEIGDKKYLVDNVNR